MQTIVILASIGFSLISIIYAVVITRLIQKKNSSNKRLSDAIDELKSVFDKKNAKRYSSLSLVGVVALVAILYGLSWKPAIGFLVGILFAFVLDWWINRIVPKSIMMTTDSAKKSFAASFNIAGKSSNVVGFAVAGLSLLAVAGLYGLFKDANVLICLIFGATIATLVSQFDGDAGKESNILLSYELFTIALAGSMFLFKSFLPDFANAVLLPLAMASGWIVLTLIGTLLLRPFKKISLDNVIYYCLAATALLAAVGYYFLIDWMMLGNGQASTLIIFFCAMIGFAAVKLAILAVKKYQYSQSNSSRFTTLIALVIAAIVLSANYLASGIGLITAILSAALAASYFAFMANFAFVSEQSEILSKKIDLPQELQEKIINLGSARETMKSIFTNYSALIALLSALLLFMVYARPIQIDYAITNAYLLAGLIIGVIVPYFIYSLVSSQVSTSFFKKAWLSGLIIIVLPLGAMTLLGETMLTGLLIGIVLSAILIALRFALAGTLSRFAIIIAILAFPLLSTLHMTLLIKLIILGALAVIVAAIILFGLPAIRKSNGK